MTAKEEGEYRKREEGERESGVGWGGEEDCSVAGANQAPVGGQPGPAGRAWHPKPRDKFG